MGASIAGLSSIIGAILPQQTVVESDGASKRKWYYTCNRVQQALAAAACIWLRQPHVTTWEPPGAVLLGQHMWNIMG